MSLHHGAHRAPARAGPAPEDRGDALRTQQGIGLASERHGVAATVTDDGLDRSPADAAGGVDFLDRQEARLHHRAFAPGHRARQ